MILLRDDLPETILTDRLLTPSDSDRYSISKSLAAPSTGGARSLTFNAVPWIPLTSFLDARG